MVEGYARYFNLKVSPEEMRAQAIEWATTRGSRSGRVAWQFVQELAGRLGVKIED
jgi:predicted AAA+ superfamily ATPase